MDITCIGETGAICYRGYMLQWKYLWCLSNYIVYLSLRMRIVRLVVHGEGGGCAKCIGK